MKDSFLHRYELTTDNKIIIDVSVGRIKELYEDYDSAASYIKKDLDQDFVEYLIDCVREIRRHDFIIRINIPYSVESTKKKRLTKSIHHYFAYLEQVEKGEIRKLLRRSFSYFCLGIAFLLPSMVLPFESEENFRVGRLIFQEGLIIGAWVSIWQGFANLLFELSPHLHNIKIYQRIYRREVTFQEGPKRGAAKTEQSPAG